MAIISNQRTKCSNRLEVLNSTCFGLLMCLLGVVSILMVCLSSRILTIQMVFVIVISAITFLTFIIDVLTCYEFKKVSKIRTVFALCNIICAIMWMFPISVFWSYIPIYITTSYPLRI